VGSAFPSLDLPPAADVETVRGSGGLFRLEDEEAVSAWCDGSRCESGRVLPGTSLESVTAYSVCSIQSVGVFTVPVEVHR